MKLPACMKPGRRFKTGAAAALTTAVVVALAVAVNLLAAALPSSITQLDISAEGLYTLGDSTKTLVSGLEKETVIYYLAQEGAEDSSVTTLLDRYAELSGKLSWQLKDPAVYPTFAHNYDDAAEGSVIVTCGDNYQVLDQYDLYQYEYDYNTGGYNTSFDAENQITSAIRYVTSDTSPVIYLLKGHSESDLPSDITDQLKQQNLTTQDLNLLNEESVPEDAAALLMVSPQKDLTDHEAQLLKDYLAGGGQLMLFTDLSETDTPLLDGILADYGLSPSGGLVVETDTSMLYGGYPNVLLPNISTSSLFSQVDQDGYVLLDTCEGILTNTELEDVTVTKLLTTSEGAISKTGWQTMTTWDKEEGDLDGPFAVGAWAQKTVSTGTDDETADAESAESTESTETTEDTEDTGETVESSIVWFTSSSLLNSQLDMMVNGNNSAVVLSALSQLAGQDVESLGIAAKSLSVDYLTVSTGQMQQWNMISMYLLPLAALVIGIVIVLRRRKA